MGERPADAGAAAAKVGGFGGEQSLIGGVPRSPARLEQLRLMAGFDRPRKTRDRSGAVPRQISLPPCRAPRSHSVTRVEPRLVSDAWVVAGV